MDEQLYKIKPFVWNHETDEVWEQTWAVNTLSVRYYVTHQRENLEDDGE